MVDGLRTTTVITTWTPLVEVGVAVTLPLFALATPFVPPKEDVRRSHRPFAAAYIKGTSNSTWPPRAAH